MIILPLALMLAAYIFKALGMYTIAEQRRIDYPWLAWVPVANGWLLGCISDQYRYVTRGESRKLRTVLVVFPVIEAVLAIAVFAAAAGSLIAGGEVINTATVIISILLSLVRLTHYMIEQAATFDLHRSCNPETAVLFLVLGLIVPGLRSVFLFANWEQELGMPPRKVTAV